jgi:CRP/FNR family nitrogen fixation transcriptional regulator
MSEVFADAIYRAPRHPLRDLDGLAQTFGYALHERICNEWHSDGCWYRVISGAARRCLLRADGSRRTLDIMVEGDYFGFYIPDDHGLLVEAAAEDTVVAIYPRWCVEFLVEVEPDTRRALSELGQVAIGRLRAHFFFGRRMTATSKVSCFILAMADRLRNAANGWFELPIGLDEIANYLELSPITLTDCLTFLHQCGTIDRVGDGRFRILARGALTVADAATSPPRPSVTLEPTDHALVSDRAPFMFF